MTRSPLILLVFLCAAVSADAQLPTTSNQATPPPPAPTSQGDTQPQPSAANQTPTPRAPAPVTPLPSPAGFCKSDSREEVKIFCPRLTRLLSTASSEAMSGKTADVISHDVGEDLEYLDPATENAQEEIAKSVSTAAVSAAIQNSAQGVLQAANQMTTSQQAGAASSGVAGTTSLVSKAGSSAIINLAVDSGALTNSISGSTATLTANTDEMYSLVTGSPEYILDPSPNWLENHVLNPLSLSASFALNQGSTTSTPATGQASGTTATTISSVAIPSGAGKLTAFTAKYVVPNKYDPRSKKFKDAWTKEQANLMPLEIAEATASFAITTQLESDPTYKAFVQIGRSPVCQNALLSDAMKGDASALMNDFETQCWHAELGPALQTISPNLLALAQTYVTAQSTLRNAYKDAILDAAGTMFSAQYTFNKPANQPATHDLTAIFDYTAKTSGSLTLNGAVSIYNETLPAGANYGRIHYGQVSAEYDRNLNKPSSSYQTQMSLAGYWQYQPQPSVLNIAAGTVVPGTSIPLTSGTQEFVGTAGSLWVGQAKLTIKGPGGVNIPFAVSGSNKTDLLAGSKIGGQIGLSYDFSSLGSLFGH